MKKLSYSSLIQAFAFLFLFLMPFTQFWQENYTRPLCLILFGALSIWFVVMTEDAKRELKIPKGRFQKVYRQFGFVSVFTVLGIIFAICGVLIVSGLIDIVVFFASSSSSTNLLEPVMDFLEANHNLAYYALFLLLIAAALLTLVNDYRIMQSLRRRAKRRPRRKGNKPPKLAFAALRNAWLLSTLARIGGVIYFIYLQYYVLVKDFSLTEQENYEMKVFIVGILFAVQLLYTAYLMRVDEILFPSLTEKKDGGDDKENKQGGETLPVADKNAEK